MAVKSAKASFDVTLYLVTDENPSYLAGKDLAQTVEDSIKGGVTLVQYRQKHSSPQEKVRTAAKLLEVTRRHNIPLLINDDIATCLAVGAEGVHIGQDDMSLKEARARLGENAIIGVTTSSIEEANAAIEGGADYLGIGTMFATPTKTDSKSILGTRGTQIILGACETGTGREVPCVAIGGINSTNIQRVLHQSAHLDNRLNGVAIISAIMASADPQAAARELRHLIDTTPYTFYASITPGRSGASELSQILNFIPSIIRKHALSNVLCHNMTNTVVQNFAANVCLATGSSPIMSVNGSEAPELAQLGGALVVNMGTITPDALNGYTAGLRAYNAVGGPVLLDPVGGGATSIRKAAIKTLMGAGFFDIIKGNEGEITAVVGTSEVKQHGVDSGASSTTPEQKAAIVKSLAQREHCVILMTGATDYISDGTRTFSVSNGSHWLGKITGSGCALGSVVASYIATHKHDKLLAALAGILHYELAAEEAVQHGNVRGPGSFIPAFLDELYNVAQAARDGKEMGLNGKAKIEKID